MHSEVVAKELFKLSCERLLNFFEVLVELLASLADRVFRLDSAIRVHFHFNPFFEGVGFLVASEPYMRVFKQLVAHRVSEGVVLLRDHNGSCVLLAQVVYTFDHISSGEALSCELSASRSGTDKLHVLKH